MLIYNLADSLLFHELVPLNRGISCNQKSLFEHCIAFRLKLVSWFPFRKLVAIRYFVTNFEYKLNVLHRAGEVPIGLNFIGDLVVISRVVLVGLGWRVLRKREKMLTLANVKRRQANFRELEIIGAINFTFLRAAVGDCLATLLFGRGSEKIVERGKTKTQILNIARFAPDVQGIEVDVRQRLLQRIQRMLCIIFCAK